MGGQLLEIMASREGRSLGSYYNGAYRRAGYYSGAISEAGNLGDNIGKIVIVRGGFGSGYSVSS